MTPHRTWGTLAAVVAIAALTFPLEAAGGWIRGTVTDPQGKPVEGATVRIAGGTETRTDPDGAYRLALDGGEHTVIAESESFVAVQKKIAADGDLNLDLRFTQLAPSRQSTTVVADVTSGDVLNPDPAQRFYVRDEMLDANPGRPGAPVSIPGLPVETASGGIKAPQYFSPGVAGDHGEPIAQFYQIGDFLYPNNLPANAHGNGYADPNFLIPPIIEGVRVDGAAFNVREGNNSVDLAASYIPRQHMSSFVQLTGDYRDADLMGGWSSADPQ